jgi:hypothetical protein
MEIESRVLRKGFISASNSVCVDVLKIDCSGVDLQRD